MIVLIHVLDVVAVVLLVKKIVQVDVKMDARLLVPGDALVVLIVLVLVV